MWALAQVEYPSETILQNTYPIVSTTETHWDHSVTIGWFAALDVAQDDSFSNCPGLKLWRKKGQCASLIEKGYVMSNKAVVPEKCNKYEPQDCESLGKYICDK